MKAHYFNFKLKGENNMRIAKYWHPPEILSGRISYSYLQGYFGIYCIAISDNYYISYRLGKNKIVYFGSGDLYSRITAHSNPNSWSGNPEVQNLLKKRHFLEFTYLLISGIEEELRSLEGDLIEEFEKRYGSKPIGNKQIPSKIEGISLPSRYFKVITKYSY